LAIAMMVKVRGQEFGEDGYPLQAKVPTNKGNEESSSTTQLPTASSNLNGDRSSLAERSNSQTNMSTKTQPISTRSGSNERTNVQSEADRIASNSSLASERLDDDKSVRSVPYASVVVSGGDHDYAVGSMEDEDGKADPTETLGDSNGDMSNGTLSMRGGNSKKTARQSGNKTTRGWSPFGSTRSAMNKPVRKSILELMRIDENASKVVDTGSVGSTDNVSSRAPIPIPESISGGSK
jgi:hypothetical protein